MSTPNQITLLPGTYTFIVQVPDTSPIPPRGASLEIKPQPQRPKTPPIQIPAPVRNFTFAPYCDVGGWPLPNLPTIATEANVDYIALGFIVASNGAPVWGGCYERYNNFGQLSTYVKELRARGKDIVVSFGGQAGQELATAIQDPDKLYQAYCSVIDYWNLNWVDFDIEGGALNDVDSNLRRSLVIERLMDRYPKLTISMTLPVLDTGFTENGLKYLALLNMNACPVHVWNLMTMDYGRKIQDMGAAAINAANSARRQIIDAGFQNPCIGICPMIGNNDTYNAYGERFTQDDARTVLQFAKKTPWVTWLSFWSLNRDNGNCDMLFKSTMMPGVKLWEFSNIFSST